MNVFSHIVLVMCQIQFFIFWGDMMEHRAPRVFNMCLYIVLQVFDSCLLSAQMQSVISIGPLIVLSQQLSLKLL